MISSRARSRKAGRRSKSRGLAAVELALLLPLLIFACMAVVDFARVLYAMVVLQNCARSGALYEFYSAAGCSLPAGWTSLSAAVQADAGNMTVTIPSTYNGNSNPYSPQASSGNYVTVTVQSNFTLLTLGSNGGLPSIGSSMTLTQSASMPMPASTGTVP
jgi:Flp pilus assembly protein TadG